MCFDYEWKLKLQQLISFEKNCSDHDKLSSTLLKQFQTNIWQCGSSSNTLMGRVQYRNSSDIYICRNNNPKNCLKTAQQGAMFIWEYPNLYLHQKKFRHAFILPFIFCQNDILIFCICPNLEIVLWLKHFQCVENVLRFCSYSRN